MSKRLYEDTREPYTQAEYLHFKMLEIEHEYKEYLKNGNNYNRSNK